MLTRQVWNSEGSNMSQLRQLVILLPYTLGPFSLLSMGRLLTLLRPYICQFCHRSLAHSLDTLGQ